MRCKLENRDTLFTLAKETDISSYLLVSQNIEILHGRNNVNIIGGGFEAFVGALFIVFGLSKSKDFVLEVIKNELDIQDIAENESNYKDLILQLYNYNHWGNPVYKVIKEEGPDHKKIFIMGIYLHGKLMGKGKASSKKKAEQIASKNMYIRLKK
jgi:ribonuclease-3